MSDGSTMPGSGSPRPDGSPPAGPAPEERRVRGSRAVVVTLVVVGAMLLLTGLAFRASRHTDEADVASPGASGAPGAVANANASSDFLQCTQCHKSLDTVLTNGSPVDKLLNYTHQMHFAKGVSDCANCHPLPAHLPDQINKPTMSKCFVCHGTGKSAIAPGTCQTCHPAGSPTIPSTHTQGNWLKDHPTQAQANPYECAVCHAQSFCQNCHGLPTMPHPNNWANVLHVQTFFQVGFSVCQNCHQVGSSPSQDLSETHRDFCDRCHHPQGPSSVPWIQYHPTVVKAGDGQQCFQCHSPVTCATCHTTGVEDLGSDKANFLGGTMPSISPAAKPSPSASGT